MTKFGAFLVFCAGWLLVTAGGTLATLTVLGSAGGVAHEIAWVLMVSALAIVIGGAMVKIGAAA